MQNIGYIIDKLLRNHVNKIIVIHWISYQPFEQPGPVHLQPYDLIRARLLKELIGYPVNKAEITIVFLTKCLKI